LTYKPFSFEGGEKRFAIRKKDRVVKKKGKKLTKPSIRPLLGPNARKKLERGGLRGGRGSRG